VRANSVTDVESILHTIRIDHCMGLWIEKKIEKGRQEVIAMTLGILCQVLHNAALNKTQLPVHYSGGGVENYHNI
jgi:hypothetical protein